MSTMLFSLKVQIKRVKMVFSCHKKGICGLGEKASRATSGLWVVD